jgi:hypothetical protein
MRSRILAVVEHMERFDDDVRRILSFTQDNTEYSEFRIGDWKSYVLWNASGHDDDGLVAEGAEPARATPRGSGLPAINRWIASSFDTRYLRLVRVHSMGEGVLVPHRDFLEFDERGDQWLRLHLTLKTNPSCLHAEEDEVFHMRPGELWHLDAARLHSATNASDDRRLNLCLDFHLAGAPASAVFRDLQPATGEQVPGLAQRRPLDQRFLDGLLGLSEIVDADNYRHIVGLLSRVPFYRQAGLSQFFDWLVEVSRRSGSQALLARSQQYCEFLRGHRTMHQRFIV